MNKIFKNGPIVSRMDFQSYWTILGVSHSKSWRNDSGMPIDFFAPLTICPSLMNFKQQVIRYSCELDDLPIPMDDPMLLLIGYFFPKTKVRVLIHLSIMKQARALHYLSGEEERQEILDGLMSLRSAHRMGNRGIISIHPKIVSNSPFAFFWEP